jgi:hypothetical protein
MLKKTQYAVFAAIFCFCGAAQASSLSISDANSKKFDLKHPTDWLELGGDFRSRMYYDQARKFSKDKDGDRIISRNRARVWGKIKLDDDIDLNIMLVTEPRYYIRPDSIEHPFQYHEIMFNKFNLTFRNAFNLPLTIVAGRQEIRLGSGWLICDGTALDYGRTGYFDALRFTYDMPDIDTVADLALISNYADSAKYLKPINDRDMDLSEQDESGGILYIAKKTGKDAGIDLYFIYKHDSDRKTAAGSEGEIYTLGLRKYGRLNEKWQYSMEFAPQFGNKNGKSLGAFATNNQLIYSFHDKNDNKIYLGYEYLSGDDDPDKHFDRGWGRLDSWSVLYQGMIDSIDGRTIDGSNLHRFYVDWSTKLAENMDFSAGYALLLAATNTNEGGTDGMSKSGIIKGHLLKAQLKLKYTKNLIQTFDAEALIPGNFYNEVRNNVAVFAKTDIIFTW